MSEEVRAFSNRQSGGLKAELEKLFSSVVRHLVALGSLASEEGREVLGRYLTVALLFIVAVFMAVFGYGTFIVFLGVLAVKVFRIDALWVSLGLVLIQVLVALGCGLVIRATLKLPLFPETVKEIRKDLESLQAKKP